MDQANHLTGSLFGYNKNQVKQLVENKDQQIKELQTSLSEQAAKLAEIEEKLKYYTDLEEALKAGIVDARVTGNNIINESKSEAEQLLNKTNEQVTQYKEDFAYQSRELIHSGTDLRDSFNEMKIQMQEIMKRYQDLIEETDFNKLYPGNQVERLLHQTEQYESDAIFSHQSLGNRKLWQENTLNEEEKKELEKLIQDVIANEAKTPKQEADQISVNLDNKLVDFALLKSK